MSKDISHLRETDPDEWNRLRHEHAKSSFEEGKRLVATTPPPDGQKYAPGTFVWINKDLGPSMSHFENDRPARVVHTYSHAYPPPYYGSKNVRDYCLLVRYNNKTWSEVSWYYEQQLTEIKDEKLIKQYLEEIGSREGTSK